MRRMSASVRETVDGDAVPAALFDADRPTDPGAHEIKASAIGYQTSVVTVQLPDGGSSAVSLTLEPDPNAGTAGGAAAAPGGVTMAPSPSAPSAGENSAGSTGPNRVPAIVAFAAFRFPGPFLELTRAAPEVESRIRDYLGYIAWGVPAALLFRLFSSFTTGG